MTTPEDPNQPPRRSHPLEQRPNVELDDHNGPRERIVINAKRQTPILSYALIAINIVIYFVGMISPEIGQRFLIEGSSFGSAVFGRGEYYRLLTAMFLHANLAHIFFNMYALQILGTQTEQMYGPVRFLSIYFLGGITGSILSAALGNPRVPSVGASGAVFALIGCQILFFYRYRDPLGALGRGAFQQYLMLLFINLMFGFLAPNIDNLGHLGGLIGGSILGWLLTPTVTANIGMDISGMITRVIQLNPGASPAVISTLYALALIGVVMITGVLVF